MKKLNLNMKNQNTKYQIPNAKGSKGITLVALIITIIVLLILAVVAIGAVNNTGIIQYAQNSADEYTGGRDNETAILQSYAEYINEKDPNAPKEVSDIIGLYGDKSYAAIEFITETTGKIYGSEGGESIMEVTFLDNKVIMQDGTMLSEYTFEKIEGVDNKAIFFEFAMYSTNGSLGFNNSVLDGKSYDGAYIDINFADGVVYMGGTEAHEYIVYNSKIWTKVDGKDGCYTLFGNGLSSDYSTFVWDPSSNDYTYTLKQ